MLTPTRGKARKIKAFCTGLTAGLGNKQGQAAAAKNKAVAEQQRCKCSLKKFAKSNHLVALANLITPFCGPLSSAQLSSWSWSWSWWWSWWCSWWWRWLWASAKQVRGRCLSEKERGKGLNLSELSRLNRVEWVREGNVVRRKVEWRTVVSIVELVGDHSVLSLSLSLFESI